MFSKIFAFAQCAIWKYMSGLMMLNPVFAVAAKKRQYRLRQCCLPAVRTCRVRICVLYKANVQPWCYL